MADLFENPLGTDGFEFVEFCGNTAELGKLFERLGFTAVAKHKDKDVTLYRQGGISFLLNAEKEGQGAEFAKEHNSGANAMAFRVKDAKAAHARALGRAPSRLP